IIGAPFLVQTVQNIQMFSLPDTRYLLWRWTDANIPTDGMILMHQMGELEDTWNRPWSGYDGVKTFQWWFEEDPTKSTPRQYFDRGIAYFAMSDVDRAKRFTMAGMDSFINQLTLIKTIAPSGNAVGPTIHFYRMVPPQTSANFIFGEQITLVGYDL